MDDGLASYLKKQIEKNSCIGLGFAFLYTLLRKPTTQSVITILLTAINSLNFAFAATKGFLLRTVFLVVFDILVAAALNMVNKRDKSNLKYLLNKNKELDQNVNNQFKILTDIIKINRTCSLDLFRLSESIITANNLEKDMNKQDMKNIFSLAVVADNFCDILYKLFKEHYGSDKINVMLYLQFPKNNKSTYIIPIAFANEFNTQPRNMREKYELYSSDKNKSLIIKLFESKRSDNKILLTPDEIYKEIAYDEESESNNELAKQYIGIPIRNRCGNIAAVMQLTFLEAVIPKNAKEQVDEFILRNVCPYLSLLEFVYEQEHIIDIMNDIILSIRREKHETRTV